MKTHADPTKNQEHTSLQRPQKAPSAAATLADHRPQTVQQRQLLTGIQQSSQVLQAKAMSEGINNSPRVQKDASLLASMQAHAEAKAVPVQRMVNNTGLPDRLKTGIEQLSGYAMDDVKVHYNSLKPAQLQAHAYAQGTHIHLAPGQEKHLPNEAWHVVQQKQGRVKPTMQFKAGVNINDDKGLEKKADVMGVRAIADGWLSEYQPSLLKIPYATHLPSIVQKTGEKDKEKDSEKMGSGKISELLTEKKTYRAAISEQIKKLKDKLGDDAYNRRVKVIKKPKSSEMDSKGYIVYKTTGNLSEKECKRIAFKGMAMKSQDEQLTKEPDWPCCLPAPCFSCWGVNKKKLIEDAQKETKEKWEKLNPYEKQLFLTNHMTGNGMKYFPGLYPSTKEDKKVLEKYEPLFQATSRRPSLLYDLDLNQDKDKKNLVYIIALSDDHDLVYDPLRDAKKDLKDEHRREREISVAGGIRGESIIWAAMLEPAMEFDAKVGKGESVKEIES